VTYACVLFSIAHRAAGAAEHPAFPAPSIDWRVAVFARLGRNLCLENAKSCPPPSCPASGGASSIPEASGSSTSVSGILDRPHSRAMTVSGCLKFESENTRSSRISELLAARNAVKWRARSGTHNRRPLCTKIVRHRELRRIPRYGWVPAFAGTTADGKNATLRSGQSYSAAAANRLFSSSASSRACSARAFLMLSSLM
jgi:hypothetical protein